MKAKLSIVLGLAFLILLLDQWTKSLVVTHIPFGGEIIVWDGFFDIVHARNTGAAFGLFAGWDSPFRDFFFYGLFFLAFVFLFSFLKQTSPKDKFSPICLGLIFGGALGNLCDRIFRGSVVDFLSLHWRNEVYNGALGSFSFSIPLIWPSFNVADSAITVGVLWLFLLLSRKERG